MLLYKTTIRRAQEELVKRQRDLLYQKRPDLWYIERFGEPITNIKWSEHPFYKGHTWDGTRDPFFTAFMALANGEWVGIESATSTGKTFILPRFMYWFLDVFPNSSVITTAPKKEQLEAVLWKEIGRSYGKFKKIRPHSSLMSLKLRVDNRKTVDALDVLEEKIGHEAIGFVSGVDAGAESATRMQGFHAENMLFILEECAGLKPAVMKAVINTCTGSNNLIIGVGNPDSQVDALHEFCMMSKVKHIIVSGYDHPNIVHPEKREIIPGAVSQGSIDLRRDEYGEDNPFYKSRVRGIAPTEGTDSAIRMDWVRNCDVNDRDPKHRNVAKEIQQDNSAPAVGVDVANSESGDMAALAWGRGNVIEEIQEFQCPNATDLAYNLFKDDYTLRKDERHVYGTSKLSDYGVAANHIGVDSVGVGTATINAFHENRIKAISLVGGPLETAIKTDKEGKPLYEFYDLRSQMFWELREDLRLGRLKIALGSRYQRLYKQLIKELVIVRYEIRGGKIKIESKDDIKKRLGGKSPNLADAVMYWNWVRKRYYRTGGALPFGKSN